MSSDLIIQNRYTIIYIRILKAFICIGVLAAILNYIYNRSLWTDEAMIATNIINKNYRDLLKPLDMNQVAPIGFLLIEKTLVNLFGNNDWVLRIFPLLSYLLSIYIFYKLSFLLFNSSKLSATACCIFSLNVLLIYFSSEVKQYSSDVLMSLTIFYFTFKVDKIKSKKSLTILAAVGVLAIWISNIGIVILFVSCSYLLYLRFVKQKGIYNDIFIPIVLWIITFLIYYSLFIYNHPSKAYMIVYWSNSGSFLPKNVLTADFYKFIYFKIGLIFNYMFRFRTYWHFGFLFFIIGLISAIKNNNRIVLLIFPVVIHFCLSAIKLYPFDTRLILYQIPLFIIFFVKGLFVVYDFIDRQIIRIPVYLILLPAFLNIYSVIKQTPYQRQEVKKSLDYINSQVKEGESIYVYRKGIVAFNFYVEKYKNIKKSAIIYGTWKKTSMDSLNADVAKIKNNNWILFSNVYAMNEWSDEKYFIDVLLSKGFNIKDTRKFVGSSCYQLTINK